MILFVVEMNILSKCFSLISTKLKIVNDSPRKLLLRYTQVHDHEIIYVKCFTWSQIYILVTQTSWFLETMYVYEQSSTLANRLICKHNSNSFHGILYSSLQAGDEQPEGSIKLTFRQKLILVMVYNNWWLHSASSSLSI